MEKKLRIQIRSYLQDVNKHLFVFENLESFNNLWILKEKKHEI